MSEPRREIADEIATLIVQVSVHEVSDLSQVWRPLLSDHHRNLLYAGEKTLDNESQVLFYAEYTALLLAFSDRLASLTMADEDRAGLLGPIMLELESAFARQHTFGDSEVEQAAFYRDLLRCRLDSYARCASIMGEGEDQLVFTAALLLVARLAPGASSSEREGLVLETAKCLTKSLLALLTTPSFEWLSSVPKAPTNQPPEREIDSKSSRGPQVPRRKSTTGYRLGRWVRHRLRW